MPAERDDGTTDHRLVPIRRLGVACLVLGTLATAYGLWLASRPASFGWFAYQPVADAPARVPMDPSLAWLASGLVGALIGALLLVLLRRARR